ncbi:MAG: hypothetical protein HOP11_01410 [Saprospiraceae bacterium]|nr:hypothetical protein [Saprospiraceae bacterium]
MNQRIEQESVLSDLIHTVRQYGVEIKKSSRVFLVFAVPVFAYFIYKQITNYPQYVAKSSFMLNESGGDNSGISAILGQFGIATPGQNVSLQKIIEIAKTRLISEKVFLTKGVVNGKEDFMGNHFIASLDAVGEWCPSSFFKKDDPLKSFRFNQTDISKFSNLEATALKKLHLIFLKKLETSFNEKTGIMEMATVIPDQDLSYELSNKMFDELSRFYIDKTVERQQETYNKLKFKVDSIRGLMNRKDYSLANLKDTYRSTWTYQDVVPQAQTDRDIRTLNMIYAEVLKNLEIASFTLQNQTPFIQALDLPIKPLEVRKPNLFMNLFKSIAYTILFSAIFIMIRKLIRDNY